MLPFEALYGRKCRTPFILGSDRRRLLEFKEGDYVYLKVSPLRGMRRFKVKGKLSPRFIGPFLILKRVGEVAYQLELPDHLADVHDVFHVSQLKKCLRVPEEKLPMEDLSVHETIQPQVASPVSPVMTAAPELTPLNPEVVEVQNKIGRAHV